MKVPNIELWKQAVAELEVAIDALDQAQSTMKDINCHGIQAKTFGSPNVKMLVAATASLLEELKTTDCDECNHPVAGHDSEDSCCQLQYCDCDWGQRSAAAQGTSANTAARVAKTTPS